LREACRLRPFSVRRVNGYETTLKSGETLKIVNARTATRLDTDLVLLVPSGSEPSRIAAALERGEGRWLNIAPIDISTIDAAARGKRLATICTKSNNADGRNMGASVRRKDCIGWPQPHQSLSSRVGTSCSNLSAERT
jgi:hypothetical protein